MDTVRGVTGEEKLRLLTSRMPVVLWTIDRDLRFTSSEGAGLSLLGLEAGEVVGLRLQEYFGDDHNADPAIRAHERALEGRTESFKLTHRGISFQAYVEPIRDESGQITGGIGFAVDITEQEQAARRVEESEEHYRGLIENASDIIALVNEQGRALFLNPAVELTLGYSLADLTGRDLFELVHPEDAEDARDALENLLAGGTEEPRLLRLRHRDGSWRWLQVRGRADLHPDHPPRLFLSASDVTDVQQAQETATRMGMILEDSVNEIYLFDAETIRFLYVNRGGRENLGYSMEELLQATPLTIKPDFTPESFRDLLQPILSGRQERLSFTTRHRRRDGTLYPVEITLQQRAFGDRSAVLAVVLDITERRSFEERQALLATAVVHAAESILICTTDGIIEYVNPAFIRSTGFSAEESRGRSLRDFLLEAEAEAKFTDLRTTVLDGRKWESTVRVRTRSGRYLEEEATASAVRDEDGQVVYFVVLQRDVSKERALERQLHQAQKMEALGVLAGGIAHDFNNILTPVLGYAQLMKEEGLDAARFPEYVNRLIGAANRARDLVRQILSFSRMGDATVSPVWIHLAVGDPLKLLRASLPPSIRLKENIDRNCGAVMVNPAQVHQIVMNLCTNAIHAMRENGGTLEVSLSRIEAGEALLTRFPLLQPGPYARISVRDTGSGIPPEMLGRIFEPFFTTKDTGEGTGLGLSVIHGIVASLDGAVDVESTPGVGSRFDVYLPITESGAAIDRDEDDEAPRGEGRVLLVDDDEQVGEVIRDLVESLGYEVVTARHGAEALWRLEQEPERFDVIVADQMMPRMTGLQLARSVRARTPVLPVILVTGHGEDLTRQEVAAAGVAQVLRKPFDRVSLARSLAETLRSRAARIRPGDADPAE